MASLTAYSTTADGMVRNHGAGSWSSIQSAATGTDSYNAQTGIASLCYADGTTADKYIDRSFYYFDLSSIPSNATIDAVTFSVYVTSASSGAGGSVTVVEGTQSATLTTADFDACGTTEFVAARTNFASLTGSAYNNFALNSAGQTYVQGKFGSTAKLCLRSSFDLDNSAPGTTVWSSMNGYFTDRTGTSEDPKISVGYTVPARTTSDSWAWSDSNTMSPGGGTTVGYLKGSSDTWAWSDAPTIYRRAAVDVLVRNAVNTTTVATSSYTGGGTMNVVSTASLASSGWVLLQASSGLQQAKVTYTGKTSTTLTGCSMTSFLGSSTFVVGSTVCPPDAESHFPRVTKLDTTSTPPLMVSYTQHGSHAGLSGSLKFKISYDGGVTWGSEQSIVSAPANGDAWGVYGHTLSRLKNGRLFAMWYEHKYDYTVADTITYLWTMASYSDDNGSSWSTPVEYDTPFAYGTRAGSCGFASEVYTGAGSNSTYGDLYVPVFGNDDGIQVHSTGETYRWYSKMMKITDGGASGTWSTVGTMATFAQCGNRAVGEPGFAMLSDDLWVAHFRVENQASGETSPYYPYYQRWQAVSTDQGATWTGHTRVNPLGNGGVVFQIPGGTLISSGQDLDRAPGCTDYISFDQGATWAFNRIETTDGTYAYYNGSDAELIIDDAYVSRNTAFTWGDETSSQLGARTQFRWFFDPSRSYDEWVWSDTATQTHSFGRTTADGWGWSDTAGPEVPRSTSDAWAWSDSVARVYTQSRFTPYPFAEIYETWNWSDAVAYLPSFSRTTSDAWAWSDVASTGTQTLTRTTSDTWTFSSSASGSVGPIMDTWSWADIATVTTVITGVTGLSGFNIQSVVGAEVVCDGVVDASLTFTAVV